MNRVEIERWFDTLMLGSLHDNNTIDQYKQYGQGGPGHQGQIYTINGTRIEIKEFGLVYLTIICKEVNLS